MPRKKKNIYWTTVQDQLIDKFIKARTDKSRHHYFNQLRPALNTMSEIIIRRYFKQLLEYETLSDLIDNCLVKVYVCLKSFEKSRGNSYSYFQTIIKNHLLENARKLEKKKDFISIDTLAYAHEHEENFHLKNY